MATKTNHKNNSLNDLLGVTVDFIREGTIVLDSSGNILKLNNKAIELLNLNLSKDEIAGKNFYSLVKRIPALGQIIKDNLNTRSLKSKRIFEIETDLGKSVVSLSGHMVDQGCILIIEDVKTLEEVEKIKSEFVSMASHQLRTPLTAIRWQLEELLSGDIGTLSGDQKIYIERALQSTMRQIKLVKNLLNISRLEQKRLTVDPQPTDIIQLVEEVVAEHKPLAKIKNCDIMLFKPSAVVKKINIDQALIRQVLVNLISNAVKYSTGLKKEKTRVEVNVEIKKNNIVINVNDSGIGVPHSLRHKIFKKFFRADNVFKLETDGTGLGLYIAKLIVEASGGTIWFKSEENKGSTFSFSLPLKGSKHYKGERTLT